MLSDEQTKAARWLDEVRQYLTAAADSSMSRNNSEQLAYELLEAFPAVAALFEVRKDYDALIRQMLEALKAGLKEVIATGENEGVLFGPDQHVDAKLQAAISAATARLEKAP